MAVGGLEIPGVVPPFGAVVGVVEVVAWELILQAGLRGFVLRAERQTADEHQGDRDQLILHGPPRWDSAASRHGRDKSRRAQWQRTQPSALQEARPQASGTGWSSRTT